MAGVGVVRPAMKRTATIAFALFGALILAVIFQNCGGYQAGYNPLTDGQELPSCLGSSCTSDLDFIEIRVANTMPVGLLRPTTQDATVGCTASTCVDIAGYCNTAGYPSSTFYYQWKLNNAAVTARTATHLTCDGMGRFRIRVPIPPGTFDYSGLYSIDVSMTVIDEDGIELESPSGIATKSVPVTGVDLPST